MAGAAVSLFQGFMFNDIILHDPVDVVFDALSGCRGEGGFMATVTYLRLRLFKVVGHGSGMGIMTVQALSIILHYRVLDGGISGIFLQIFMAGGT